MEVQTAYPLPTSIAQFAGQIADLDGHESLPNNWWEVEFGPITNRLRDAILQKSEVQSAGEDTVFYGQVDADDVPISADTIFKVKLERAPGAISLEKRSDVLDFVGIKNQMVFPGSMPLLGCVLHAHADNPLTFPSITGDRKGYAIELIRTYNEWVLRNTRQHARYSFVGILIHDNVDDLLAETRQMIDKGVRAVWTPSAFLMGGKSPAHSALDPFWAMLAAANVSFSTHVSQETEFFHTMEWRNAEAFEGWKIGEEFNLDPWTLSSVHLSTQNFIMTMVLGGVFERHPTLRVSSSEVGANWLGPLAENMDLWHANARRFMQSVGTQPLKLKPSEYLTRNFRISPFDCEDVAGYIQRFGLEDCYCFASDFPHVEGGKRPIEEFEKNLAPMGPGILRKFFVDNAKLIFAA